jgi:hypothetical protein
MKGQPIQGGGRPGPRLPAEQSVTAGTAEVKLTEAELGTEAHAELGAAPGEPGQDAGQPSAGPSDPGHPLGDLISGVLGGLLG